MRIVGWVTSGVDDAPSYSSSGNQWARMTVPSKDVTFQSVVDPGTGVAGTGVAGSPRWHVADVVVAAVDVVVDAVEEDEQPVRVPMSTRATAAVPQAIARWRRGTERSEEEACGRIGGVLHR
jgi:hypothetical protein